MRTLQGLAGLAGVGFVVAACGGGAGPLVTTTSGNGRDEPGTTRDTPPSTSDITGGDCLACDVTYECPNAGNLGNGISLSTSQGTCTQALINLICSGALFNTAPCSGGGGGSFTCGSITCTPQAQGLPGGVSNGGSSGGSSSGGTPGTGFADAG